MGRNVRGGSAPALLVLVAGLSGCGSSSGQTSAPMTGSEACSQLEDAAAQRNARCSGGAIDAWRRYQANNLDCSAYDRHITAGLVDYHPERLAACLQKFNASCTDPDPYPCQFQVLQGKIADGQPCTDDEVCGQIGRAHV